MAGTAAAALVPQLGGRPVSYLVILADQLTWWMCDPAQRGLLDLPNIDRLRSESTNFDRCYATTPLCKPMRVSLRNGLYPHNNPGDGGLQQPADTVERRLREAGLATRYLGKWHCSPNPAPSEFVAPEDRLNWDWFIGHEVSHDQQLAFVGNDPTPVSTAPWDPAMMTNWATRMMREDVAQDRPFFLHVNYLPPHHPYEVYPNSLSVYSAQEATKRPNLGNSSFLVTQKIAHYMNLVRGVDIEIGRLLDELDTLSTDVVVIFTADHGDMLHSHGMTFKRKPFEEAVRVPLLVRGPGWKRERVTYPVGLIDLPMMLAGVGDGIPLREYRDSVYLEQPLTPQPTKNWSGGEWRAIVTDDGWKLAIGVGDSRLLYDLFRDPYELSDLAGQGHPREAELETRMREWATSLGDPFFG